MSGFENTTAYTDEEVRAFAVPAIEKLGTNVGAVVAQLLETPPDQAPRPHAITVILTLPGGQLASVTVSAMPVQL